MSEIHLSPHVIEGYSQELFISKIGGRNSQFKAIADDVLGPENWQLGWSYREQTINFLGACQLYAASYDQHFSAHPQDLDVVTAYRDVYDVHPRDVMSGTDFSSQGDYVHVQDIAIRAVVADRGRSFNESGKLLQVRSTSQDALGARLSPFNVAFVDRDAITDNPIVAESPRWKRDSVEAFYQCNRRLLIRDLSLPELFSERLNTEFGNRFSIAPVIN
jgi:hypothetical protein